MEFIVLILLIAVGVLLIASMILTKMYYDAKEDYKELAIEYFMRKEGEKEEQWKKRIGE